MKFTVNLCCFFFALCIIQTTLAVKPKSANNAESIPQSRPTPNTLATLLGVEAKPALKPEPIDLDALSPNATEDSDSIHSSNRHPPLTETTAWTRTDCNGVKTKYLVVTWPVLDQNTAKIFCEGMGANTELAAIETFDEFEFFRAKLALLASAKLRYNRFAFWLSGTDLIPHSTRGYGQYWYYSGIPILETFWGPGEPNDNNYEKRGIETCIDIKIPATSPASGYMINDEACSSLVSYICETKVTARPKPTTCP